MEPAEGDTILELLARTQPCGGAQLPRRRPPGPRRRGDDPAEAAGLLHLMSHDERPGWSSGWMKTVSIASCPTWPRPSATIFRRLASYEPGTAGAVMTTDYVTLAPQLTVREALERIRHEAPDRETIYYSYVVDPQRRLVGFVSLKTLILARPLAGIGDIMQPM